jgi:dTMP kinase
MSGKLVVIDGADGAGKATQVALLAAELHDVGFEVETLDFPQYTNNTFGRLLRECLDGKRGDFIGVDPHIASTLYAADRFESKPKIEGWLREGKIVVLDRYVSANMLHQGAKIDDAATMEQFLSWIDSVEHGIFGLPRPDIILYLDVPYTFRQRLKREAVAEHKHGSAVLLDQAESNQDHQERAEMQAQRLVASLNSWHRISCIENDAMRSREAIHGDVVRAVMRILS